MSITRHLTRIIIRVITSVIIFNEIKTKSYKIRQMVQTGASFATFKAAELIRLVRLNQRGSLMSLPYSSPWL